MSRLSYTCTVDKGREITASVDSSAHRDAPITAPDLEAVQASARQMANAPASAPVACSRIERRNPRQDKDLHWIHRRMTPSCEAFGWNPSQVVSYDKWSCRYVGKGTVRGKDGRKQQVFNPFKQWSGTLASCAGPSASEGIGIPDSTYRAVQKMAYWQADGDASDLDLDQFLCRIESLPAL